MGVLCANSTTTDSTTKRKLNLLPDIPPSAHKGHVSNELDKTLVSVPVLCDIGCEVIFKENTVQLLKNNKIMFE